MTSIPVPRPVDYASFAVPAWYHCGQCSAHGVKLWRMREIFFSNQSLLCARCACAEQGEGPVIERTAGRVFCQPSGGDQIGRRMPAVPRADGQTFWVYCDVPDDGHRWWHGLPLETPDLASGGRYPRTLRQVDEHARRHGRVSFTLAEWRQIRKRGFLPEPVPTCTGAHAGRPCTALDGCNLRGCPHFTEPCSRSGCDGGCPSIGCDSTGVPDKITT